MTGVLEHLFAADWLSLRGLLRLLLLSGLFTLAAIWAFPRNAPSRRALLLAAVSALTILPWALSWWTGVWTVEFTEAPVWTLATPLPNLLIWLWLIVAAIAIVSYLRAIAVELANIGKLPLLQDEEVNRVLAELCQALDISKPAVLKGSTACSCTVRGDILILPHDWQRWTSSTLKAVLAHELIHIHRKDDRWLILTRMLVLLYWWMPWLKFLFDSYLKVMEESCDDAASELVGERTEYVQALAQAAGVPGASANLSISNAPAMAIHHLVGRVGRFRHRRIIELDTAGVYWCVIGILVLVMFLTTFQPVTYTPVYRPPALTIAPDAPVRQAERNGATYAMVNDTLQVLSAPTPLEADRLMAPEYRAPAIYPGTAIRKGIEGDVVVEFTVNKDGSVSGARVVRSFPADVFDSSAIKAVQGSRYSRSESTYINDTLVNFKRGLSQKPHIRVQRHFRYRMVQG